MMIEKELQAKLDSLVGFNLKLNGDSYVQSSIKTGVLVKVKVWGSYIDISLLQPSGEIQATTFYCPSLVTMRDFRIEVIED